MAVYASVTAALLSSAVLARPFPDSERTGKQMYPGNYRRQDLPGHAPFARQDLAGIQGHAPFGGQDLAGMQGFPGQFGPQGPLLPNFGPHAPHPPPHPHHNPAHQGQEDSSNNGGFFSNMFSGPREYFSNLMSDVTSYFRGSDDEEEKAPRGYRPHPGALRNFHRGHPQFENLLAHGQRFQHHNSIYPQPQFNQFQQPGAGRSPFADQVLGSPSFIQSQFSGQGLQLQQGQQQGSLAQEKGDGHWTGGFSSHYKQMNDQVGGRFIHHVPSEPKAEETSSYAQQRSDTQGTILMSSERMQAAASQDAYSQVDDRNSA